MGGVELVIQVRRDHLWVYDERLMEAFVWVVWSWSFKCGAIICGCVELVIQVRRIDGIEWCNG